MNSSKIRKSILTLVQEREIILRRVIKPERMITGGLVKRWLRCGQARCCCKRGKPHGPYYYLSALKGGRPRMIYLGRGDRPEIELLKRYQDFQRSIACLNSINRKITKLLWLLAKDKIEAVKF